MSDEEGYVSSEDEDYVPSDGEAVSEEENSGDDENLDLLREDGEPIKTGKRKRQTKPQTGPRKRQGGIKLDDADVDGGVAVEIDTENKELVKQIQLEQEQKKLETEKKKSNDLWSSFMADVGTRPVKKPTPTATGLGSLSSPSKPVPGINKSPVSSSSAPSGSSSSSSNTATPTPQSTITVTKTYDFAGEAVQVTKKLDINSKEGKAELKRQQEGNTTQEDEKVKTSSPGPSAGSLIGTKKPAGFLAKKPGGGGLGGVLAKINQKPKLGTLEKSKIDWESFKQKEGIDEELKIHNRGKQSFIERQNFLQRTDVRQFEIEKSLRLSSSSKR